MKIPNNDARTIFSKLNSFSNFAAQQKSLFEKDFDKKCIFNAKIKQTSPRPSFKININVAVTLS